MSAFGFFYTNDFCGIKMDIFIPMIPKVSKWMISMVMSLCANMLIKFACLRKNILACGIGRYTLLLTSLVMGVSMEQCRGALLTISSLLVCPFHLLKMNIYENAIEWVHWWP